MNPQVEYYRNKLAFEIDATDVQLALWTSPKVLLIDARSRRAYEREHIPSALNLPQREMTEESTRHLDRDALYVTYCDGAGCHASSRGALHLAEFGFRVKVLVGGLDWWKREGHRTEGSAVMPTTPGQCGG